MILSINQTEQCWVCGKQHEKLTTHHALPRHLRPVNNITVPVCEGCHKNINATDIRGMYTYLFKIKRTIKENVQSVNTALSKLEDIEKHSSSTEKANNHQGERARTRKGSKTSNDEAYNASQLTSNKRSMGNPDGSDNAKETNK